MQDLGVVNIDDHVRHALDKQPDGTCKMQLWEAMQFFGSGVFLGMKDTPLETKFFIQRC